MRAAYNIPRDQNLKLRDFPTLAHVIEFARDRARGGRAGRTCGEPRASRRRARRCLASFEAADRVPRRVPVPVLRPPLDLCKPTGVTLGPGSRVVIMPDQGGVADALQQRLQAMGVEVLRIDAAPDAEAQANLMLDGRPADRFTESTGCPRWTTKATQPDGPRRLARSTAGARQIALSRPCAALYEQIAAAGHIPGYRRHGSADSTATTRPEPSRPWAAPSRASPRPTSASGRTPW